MGLLLDIGEVEEERAHGVDSNQSRRKGPLSRRDDLPVPQRAVLPWPSALRIQAVDTPPPNQQPATLGHRHRPQSSWRSSYSRRFYFFSLSLTFFCILFL